MRTILLLAIGMVALAGFVPQAGAQYMYLDTNGDGANTSADLLAANGSPTTVDVWLRTNADRDGSPAICNVEPEAPLNFNSYVVNLEAAGTLSGFFEVF